MDSGIEVTDDCVTEYEAMKLKKKNNRCIIYTIKDKKKIQIEKQVEKCGDQKEQYNKILKDDIEPIVEQRDQDGKNNGSSCFVVWDLKMLAKSASKGGQETDSLVFMGICMDDVNVKHRMLYSSSMGALKKKLGGIPKYIQVKCMAEMDYDEVIKAAEKMK